MLLLFEAPAGFGIFKVQDEGKLEKIDDIWKYFKTPQSAKEVITLQKFHKFDNTTEATVATASLVKGKLSKGLRKFLRTECGGETLAVADSKLGRIISEKLEIECVHNSAVLELMRGVRTQLTELCDGLSPTVLASASLGLSHSLCRHTLKFSPDKVDTMIVQAIGLLDELDKELNTYAMRVREWYGWHFPEMAKIIQDNIQYAKAVRMMKDRINATNLDFSEFLSEETETALKAAVHVSMGTELSEEDMNCIKIFCEQVISLAEYRTQLYDYLRSRMKAIAPNLTVLVGELVGARLIAHAGSLVSLAKQPSSTIQILGAEKALFRALKTKHNTPKYGIIYHASLVGQAPAKFKGKIARVLAAKSALSIRIDALGEDEEATHGISSRDKVEKRLRQLEGKTLGKLSGVSKGKAKIEIYEKERKKETPALMTAAKSYAAEADVTIESSKTGGKRKKAAAVQEEAVVEEEKPKKKQKKKIADDAGAASAAPTPDEGDGQKKKKHKKVAVVEEAAAPVVQEDGKKQKKKKKEAVAEDTFAASTADEEDDGQKKKRKKTEDAGATSTGDEEVGKKKKKKHQVEKQEPVEEPEKKKKKKKAVEEPAPEEATEEPEKKKKAVEEPAPEEATEATQSKKKKRKA